MYLLPSLSLEDIEGFTLPEIENRVQYISKAKESEQQFHLRDLSSIVFYAVVFGYSSVKSKNGQSLEKKYHQLISELLQINQEEKKEINPEKELKSLFG